MQIAIVPTSGSAPSPHFTPMSRFFTRRRTATSWWMVRILFPVLAFHSESLRAQSTDSTLLASPRSIGGGVFSAEQVGRGKQLHRATCTVCHDATGYTGETFAEKWFGRTAFDFFDRLRTTMPNDNPGALARDEYVDVMVYIFALNGYPAGARELGVADDELKQVRIDLKPSAKPATDTRDRGR